MTPVKTYKWTPDSNHTQCQNTTGQEINDKYSA